MATRSALSAALLLVSLAPCLAPVTAVAQSSLGITSGGLVSITVTSSESEGALGAAAGWVDVTITEAHGMQLGSALTDTPAGVLGHLDMHLYMTPRPGHKYGLYGQVSDLDNAHFTLGAVGAEAIFAIGPETAIEGRGGIGIAKRSSAPTSLDFIFVGAALSHDVSDRLGLGFAIEIAEFDETALRAYGYTAMAEAEYRPLGRALSLTAGVGISGLEGRDGRPSEALLQLGMRYTFGARTAGSARRPFRRADPYSPLALRGLF